MKTAILAGGLGSRLAEETVVRPKPMVEIGGRPILWHIMRHYLHYGHDDFVIAVGYKGGVIKRWMLDYAALSADLTVRPRHREVTFHRSEASEDWSVDIVDTGQSTNTGGRIKRLAPWMGAETFMLTWGDGVSDVNLDALLAFHRAHGKVATLTAVRPPARYGHIVTDGDQVVEFSEKPQIGEGWINGAFFVLEPEVFDYIDGDDTQFEKEPLEKLAKDGQLMAYHHHGFWQCMDTVRERHILDELWRRGDAPWKVWE
ncbi:glucose-1-phosphate cytidylyltransferase [Actinopolymorpha pittospori]